MDEPQKQSTVSDEKLVRAKCKSGLAAAKPVREQLARGFPPLGSEAPPFQARRAPFSIGTEARDLSLEGRDRLGRSWARNRERTFSGKVKRHMIEVRELIGYLCLAMTLFGTIGAIWAARHYSHHRVYARRLSRERRARRNCAAARLNDPIKIEAPANSVAGDVTRTLPMRDNRDEATPAEQDRKRA